MSILGLIASFTILLVFYAAKSPLPFCATPTSINVASATFAINCESVLGSAYSSVFGVPLDALACVYFIVNIALVYLVCFGSKKNYKNTFKGLLAWRLFGIATAAYLIYLELFQLKALCAYCTVMHIAIIIDLIIVVYFALQDRNMRNFIHVKYFRRENKFIRS